MESDLPDKVEKVIKVRMSGLQGLLYKQMKKHKMIADRKDAKGLVLNTLNGVFDTDVGVVSKCGGVKGLSNELMQLCKICQHPFFFEGVEDEVSPTRLIDDLLKLERSFDLADANTRNRSSSRVQYAMHMQIFRILSVKYEREYKMIASKFRDFRPNESQGTTSVCRLADFYSVS